MAEDLDPWYRARDAITRDLEHELMGPVKADPLDEPPLNRIVVGVLHPQAGFTDELYRAGMEEDVRESESGSVESATDRDTDSAVVLSHSRRPSSIGLTFAVHESETPEVMVAVTARRYADEDGSWRPVDVASDPGL